MRVILLAVALALIFASVASFVLMGPATATSADRGERALVEGQVTGDFEDRPWVGTVVHLGSEYTILDGDGRFRFAVLPGTYILTVCCSPRFQSIYQELVVSRQDIRLDLVARGLTEIPGQVFVVGGTQIPFGFVVSATQPGTNVVDRATTDIEGKFALHLMDGDWQLQVENLPEGYKLVSIAAGADALANTLKDALMTVGGPSASRLPLQITVR